MRPMKDLIFNLDCGCSSTHMALHSIMPYIQRNNFQMDKLQQKPFLYSCFFFIYLYFNAFFYVNNINIIKFSILSSIYALTKQRK